MKVYPNNRWHCWGKASQIKFESGNGVLSQRVDANANSPPLLHCRAPISLTGCPLRTEVFVHLQYRSFLHSVVGARTAVGRCGRSIHCHWHVRVSVSLHSLLWLWMFMSTYYIDVSTHINRSEQLHSHDVQLKDVSVPIFTLKWASQWRSLID